MTVRESSRTAEEKEYTIRTTQTDSGLGYRHEFLRNGKLTSYAEYGPGREPPKRMVRWLKKLNEG